MALDFAEIIGFLGDILVLPQDFIDSQINITFLASLLIQLNLRKARSLFSVLEFGIFFFLLMQG